MARPACGAAAQLRSALRPPWLLLPSSALNGRGVLFISSSTSGHRGARALRPVSPSADAAGFESRQKEDDEEEEEGEEAKEDKEEEGVRPMKSRNELKRETLRATRWGMELVKLTARQIIRAASLQREVFEAIMLVKRLPPDVREGRRRQFNYIGRLLRSVQPELMNDLIQASKDGDNSRLLALFANDSLSDEDDEAEEMYDDEDNDEYMAVAMRWLDGLVCKDSSITNEVYSIYHAEFDRQVLRKLVRRAQSVQIRESVKESDAIAASARKPLLRFLCSLARKTSMESSETH